MTVEYILIDGANPTIAKLQEDIGAMAMASVLSKSFEVSVDGQTNTVQMEVPTNLRAQKESIVIMPNSYNSGMVANQLGLPINVNTHGSLTIYIVDRSTNNTISEAINSVSFIGQETSNPDLIQETTTALCQGFEAVGISPITNTVYYRLAKAAICNSLGAAADSRYLGQTYQQYVARLSHQSIGQGIVQGNTGPYPIITEQEFSALYKS